jgi:hypothetical protein
MSAGWWGRRTLGNADIESDKQQHGHCENDQVYVPFHILNFFFVSDSEYFTAITAELPWLKAGTCPALTGKFTK